MELDNVKIENYLSEIVNATKQGDINWSKINPTTNVFTKLTTTGRVKVTVQRANTSKNDVIYVFTLFNGSGDQILKFDTSDNKQLSDLVGKLYSAIEDSYADQVYKVFDAILK